MLGKMSKQDIMQFYVIAKNCNTVNDFLEYAALEEKLYCQKEYVKEQREEWVEQEKVYKKERAILQNMCKHHNYLNCAVCLFCEKHMAEDEGGGYDG